MTRTTLTGVHHAALNVRDLDASLRWYHEVLDFSLLMPWDTGAFERRLMGHPCGLFLALTKHRHPDAESDFNERRPGLDHLAFGVPTMAEMQAWSARLTASGVEHSGVRVSPATGFTLIDFRDPDNIQLELYLAAG